MKVDHWGVDVRINGENVLTIESDCMFGIENIGEYREAIEKIIDNLKAFIGTGDSVFIPPEYNAISIPSSRVFNVDQIAQLLGELRGNVIAWCLLNRLQSNIGDSYHGQEVLVEREALLTFMNTNHIAFVDSFI